MATAMDSYYPYDAGSGSAVTEAQWGNLMRHFRLGGTTSGGGVLRGVTNALAVSQRGAGANMSVDVATGAAVVQGHYGETTATKNLSIASNSSGSTRVDRVVVRADRTNNVTYLDVVVGMPGAGAPALTQTSTVWEISLAQVSVANLAASIVNANITDERGSSAGGYYSDQYDSLYTAVGDMDYASAAGVRSRLAIGSSGQALTVSGGIPTWTTPTGLTFPYRGIAATLPVNSQASSSSEVTVWTQSVPGSTFAAGNEIRITSWGDLLNNSGSASTYTWRLKYGATTLFTAASNSVTSNANRQPWLGEWTMGIHAASSESIVGLLTLTSAATGGASGTAVSLGSVGQQWFATNTAAENTASALTLQLTLQMSVNNASTDWRLFGWSVFLYN